MTTNYTDLWNSGFDSHLERWIHTKENKPKSLQTQVGGDHYKNKKIQPVEYIHSNDLDFFEGNIVKYVTRWRDKNGLEDLLKIKQYVDILIDLHGLQEK